MKIEQIINKKEIEEVLRQNLYLNIYGIGDLDDFFWPYTTWYGLKSSHRLESILLLYSGILPPTLLGLSDNIDSISLLLTAAVEFFPEKFYAHLSLGLASILEEKFDLESHGLHYKMGLNNKAKTFEIDCSEVVKFGLKDIIEIQKLYEESYPDNWFDPRMLETKKYFGIMREGRLISLAGIHVYSPTYKVAALGNITTLPAFRNSGYGTKVAARLCQVLVEEDLDVGLNVKADNLSAIACYRKIGFEIIASYEEFILCRK